MLLIKTVGTEMEAVSNNKPDLRIVEGTGDTETIGIMSEMTKTATELVPATTKGREDLNAFRVNKIFSDTGRGSLEVELLTRTRAEHLSLGSIKTLKLGSKSEQKMPGRSGNEHKYVMK